jgi:hypothetical protein
MCCKGRNSNSVDAAEWFLNGFVGEESGPYPLTEFDGFDVVWYDARQEDMLILSNEIAVWYDRGNNGGNGAGEGTGTNLVFGSGFRPTLQTDAQGINYVALEDDSAALTFFNWAITTGYYYWIGVFDYDGDASPAEGGRIFQLSTPSTVWYMPFTTADVRFAVLVNGGSGLGGSVLSPSGKIIYELDLTRTFAAQLWNASAAMFSGTTSPTTSNTFKGKCYGIIGVKADSSGQITSAQKSAFVNFVYQRYGLTY